jgi:nucleosome binding factor SPN SPT16 subunit
MIDQAGFERVDAGALVSAVLAIKDDIEMTQIKKACEYTSKIFTKYLKDQIINIVDSEKVIAFVLNLQYLDKFFT